MTKDQMRALLASLVPNADVCVIGCVGSGKATGTVKGKPATKVAVDYKRPSIKRTDKFTKRPYPTYKHHADVGAADAAHPLEFSRHVMPTAQALTPAFFCAVCDCYGKDCTC